MKPTISFNKNSGTAAKSHSVVVTVSDSGVCKLAASQKIKYRWQTSATCSTKASDYKEIALSPTAAESASATATVTLDSTYSDGDYYLCILA